MEEKKLERDFIISRYDDLLYVLRTQKTCKPLYEIIIRELSQLIVHPGARDIFYSISMGESIEKVAGRHRITYDRGLKVRKNVLATYRKHIIDARFQSLADKSKNINLNQEERVLQLSVGKVADTRLTNVLYKEEIRTVGQLLELVSGKGWRWLLKMEGVGRISYDRLLSNLQLAGVVDESLEQILSGRSDR